VSPHFLAGILRLFSPLASIQAAQTPTSEPKLRFVTPDKESSMSTLWQEEEFKQICSRESLTEKADH